LLFPSGDVDELESVVNAIEEEEDDEGSGARAGFSSNASLLFAESCFGRAGSGDDTNLAAVATRR